jgi:hypothetical protein
MLSVLKYTNSFIQHDLNQHPYTHSVTTPYFLYHIRVCFECLIFFCS